jgi:type VI secretion system secreted protein VgrG
MSQRSDRLQGLHIELWCPRGPDITWEVQSLRGHEALASPYAFELELACDDASTDAEAMLGADVELLLERNGSTRAIYGVVAQVEVEFAGTTFDRLLARIRVVPAFALLEQEIDTRVHAEQTVVEILVERLGASLGAYGRELDVTLLSGDYRKRDYCVQLRESTFAFCSRLMEDEGIAYMFVPESERQRERMVLVDANAAYTAAELLVPGPLPLAPHQGEELDRESIQRFDWRRRRTPNRVITRGYNLEQPRQFDEGEVEQPDRTFPGVREHYLHDEQRQIIDASGLQQRAAEAERVLQRHLLDATQGSGVGNAHGFRAGGVIELADAPDGQTELLLVRVEHRANRQDGGADEHTYANRFECVPRSLPFRPARRTPAARADGVQTGVVVGPPGEDIHTDALGRVKVRFHRDRHTTVDEHVSCWIRVAQAWTGNGYGGLVTPRVGMEVVVAFVDGNPDCPLVIGCVYNGELERPHELPTHASRTGIKTASLDGKGFHELRLDDAAGHEQLFVHAQRRMDVRVAGTSFQTATGNLEHTVGHGFPDNPKGDYNLTIHADLNELVRGDAYHEAHGDIHRMAHQVAVRERQHLMNVTELLQLNAGKLVLETGETISLTAADVVVAGSQDVTLKAGSKLVLDSNNAVELKVGDSFITIAADGIDIKAPKIRLNSGGFVGPTGEPEKLVPFEIAHPLKALAADDGREHAGGHAGQAGHTRERVRWTVDPIHAPPMTPPKLPKQARDEFAADGGRAPVRITWLEQETWCSQPTPLWGSFAGEGGGTISIAQIRRAADGAIIHAEQIGVGTANSFTSQLRVRDVLPRTTGDGRGESHVALLATVEGVTTPGPLHLRFLTDLPSLRWTKRWGRFDVRLEDHTVVIGGSIPYTLGWMHYIIALDDTVPEDTGGLLGHKHYGRDCWRHCKKLRKGGGKGGLVYWDGGAWKPVPNTWSDDLGTKLYGQAVWREHGQVKQQFAGLAWPDEVPEWSRGALQDKQGVLALIKEMIEYQWTGTFDLKREQCQGSDPRCCRHSIRCEVSFVEVDRHANGIILTENDGRANASAWPLEMDDITAAHEFGHHLGNPDEYPGARSVDPTVNGDGATAGIDPDGLMGSGGDLRRRYYKYVCEALAQLVVQHTGQAFTFVALPELP